MEYDAFNILSSYLPLEILYLIEDYLIQYYHVSNASKVAKLMSVVEYRGGAIMYEETKFIIRMCGCGEIKSSKYVGQRHIQSTHRECAKWKKEVVGWIPIKTHAFTQPGTSGIVRWTSITDREFEAEEEL